MTATTLSTTGHAAQPLLDRAAALLLLAFAAAVVAASLTPFLMPGLPVLVAACVAILVGWFNWLGRDTPPSPLHGADA